MTADQMNQQADAMKREADKLALQIDADAMRLALGEMGKCFPLEEQHTAKGRKLLARMHTDFRIIKTAWQIRIEEMERGQ